MYRKAGMESRPWTEAGHVEPDLVWGRVRARMPGVPGRILRTQRHPAGVVIVILGALGGSVVGRWISSKTRSSDASYER